MTKIYIIRHAEAEGNLYRLAHGWYNSHVTDFGMRQIEALAKRFENIPVHAVYSSDLKRTMTTAEAIYKKKDLPLFTDRRLREVHIGAWEDVPWGNLEKQEAENMTYFNKYPEKWFVEGAESFSNVRDRMISAIKELAAKHDGQTIALFSHGAAIRTTLCELCNTHPSDKAVTYSDNTAVSLLSVSGDDIQVEFINDSSHLGEELTHFGRNNFWKSKAAHDSSNLIFEFFKPGDNPELFDRWHEDAWMAAHGSLEGYLGSGFGISSGRASEYPDSLCCAYCGDEPVGMIELDIHRGKEEGSGHIAFYYISEDYRGTGISVQLLGHAVSVFRRLGRERLTLFVAEENLRAIGYYEHFGFVRKGITEGAVGKLIVMEKDIRV